MKLQYNEQKSSDNLAWFTAELPICNIHVFQTDNGKWHWKLWPYDTYSSEVGFVTKETAYLQALGVVRSLSSQMIRDVADEIGETLDQ